MVVHLIKEKIQGGNNERKRTMYFSIEMMMMKG